MENPVVQNLNRLTNAYSCPLTQHPVVDDNSVEQKELETTPYKTLVLSAAAVAALAAIVLISRKVKKASSVTTKRPSGVSVDNPSAQPKSKTQINPIITQPVPVISSTIQENVDKLNKIRKQYNIPFNSANITEKGKVSVLPALSAVKDKIYDELRIANYCVSGEKGIADITGKSLEKTICLPVNYDNPWHYRQPVGLKAALKGVPHALERISLNVEPNGELIKKLDEYFVAHIDDVTGYYKTPTSFEGWFKRHDPITIYLYKPASQSVLDDIAKIAAPYVRNTGNKVLLGKPFGNCCAWQRSPQPSDYEALSRRINEIFGAVENRVGNPYLIRETKLSAGEFCAYNEILNRITGQNVTVLV